MQEGEETSARPAFTPTPEHQVGEGDKPMSLWWHGQAQVLILSCVVSKSAHLSVPRTTQP